MSSRTCPTCCFAMVLFAFIMFAGLAYGQAGTAAIQGVVLDQQNAGIPGVTVTVTHDATGASRATTTREGGAYQFVSLPPGVYTLRVELSGFRPATYENVQAPVDTTVRQDVSLQIGGLAEAITVQSESSLINTVDASVGNAMSEQQIRNLPIEALNVVHLLSVQPGAVFIPKTDPQTVDPRYGAVSGSRADQQNVTLDGVDVNDPQFQTAYTSAVRMTTAALQEFRVSTSNYGADQGRSSGAQVSLVTRSGTNTFGGSTYWFHRNTRTSSNEYFLKLAQLSAGDPSRAPKLDKHLGGVDLGGPIRRNRVFFYGNFEALRSHSEAPVQRAVPSDSFRDGVLVYQCAIPAQCPGGAVRGFTGTHTIAPGNYGLTPAEIAAIDPLGTGPSQAASQYFRQYPSPNDPGLDGLNIMSFRFASPIEDQLRTFIGRVDIRPSDVGTHTFFARFGGQDDAIAGTAQFPG